MKTRLCPPLTPVAAADLARGFLLDTADRVRGLAGVTAVLAYAPASERRLFEALAPDFLLVPQPEGDLGARLAATFAELFRRGFERVVALGTDAPTLPTVHLRGAVAALARDRADVVLGPSEDGGYCLVGLRAPRPALFAGVPWSTAAVFAATVARARAAGLTLACLPPWYDVDTARDLARLEVAVAGAEGATAPHTRGFFGRHRPRLRFDAAVTIAGRASVPSKQERSVAAACAAVGGRA